MANLTEERLREMEDEMDRFEMEILSAKIPAPPSSTHTPSVAPSPMIIGAGTYDRIQEKLEEAPVRGPVAGPTLPPHMMNANSNNSYNNYGPTMSQPNYNMAGPPQNSSSYNIRPPPPPPAFMPHQLRHRPMPPPRPPFLARPPGASGPGMHPSMGGRPPGPPHMGGMYPPPPPPPMFGAPSSNYMSGPPRPPMMGGPSPMSGFQPYPNNPPAVSQPPLTTASSSSSGVISGPKVVYSAPPVRNIIKKAKREKSVAASDGAAATDSKTDAGKLPPVKISKKSSATTMEHSSNMKSTASDKTEVASNIQLNVPVEELESEKKPKAVPASSSAVPLGEGTSEAAKKEKKEKDKKRKYVRMAAGTAWEDPTLSEWDPDDFRIFCGDLGNEVTDDSLARAFGKYSSFQKARVIRDKRTNKTKGFGFVSLKDPNDFVRAIREMNGKYVGNRPIKLRKSTWQDRQIDHVKKKEKEKKRLGFK